MITLIKQKSMKQASYEWSSVFYPQTKVIIRQESGDERLWQTGSQEEWVNRDRAPLCHQSNWTSREGQEGGVRDNGNPANYSFTSLSNTVAMMKLERNVAFLSLQLCCNCSLPFLFVSCRFPNIAWETLPGNQTGFWMTQGPVSLSTVTLLIETRNIHRFPMIFKLMT